MSNTFEEVVLASPYCQDKGIKTLSPPDEWFQNPLLIKRPFTLVNQAPKIYAGEQLKQLDLNDFHQKFTQFCDTSSPEIRKDNAYEIFKSSYDLLADIDNLPVWHELQNESYTSFRII